MYVFNGSDMSYIIWDGQILYHGIIRQFSFSKYAIQCSYSTAHCNRERNCTDCSMVANNCQMFKPYFSSNQRK